MPKLVVDGSGHEIDGECVLGRHRGSGLQIKSDAASRQHAKVSLGDGLWWVEDLGSANGTSLNGSRLDERKRLRDGDVIAIGAVEITFRDEEPDEVTKVVAKPARPRPAPVPGPDITVLAGQQIGGYRIDRYLGRGMLGAVYHAHQLNLDRPVAFKVFDPERCTRDAGLSKRFLAEAGKVGSVTHDGLVQLHESGEHAGLLWCSMEWVAGDTLEKLIARDGRLEPATAFLVTEKVAEALVAAHARGVIHGDLRPSHVIVMADGRVKLTDVGMMGIFEEAEIPASAPAKEAWYLSPEEAGEGASDPRSDIYSLGCMLFHLLAGRPPYAGSDLKAVVQAHARQPIPSLAGTGFRGDIAKVDALLLGMMAKQPALRPATMAVVIAELQRVRQSVVAPVPPVRSATRASATDGLRPSRAAPSLEQQVRAYAAPVTVVVVLIVVAIVAIPMLTKRVVPVTETETTEPTPATLLTSEPVTSPRVNRQPAIAPVAPVAPIAVVAPGNDLVDRWRVAQLTVAQAQAKPDWPAAEQALAELAPVARPDPGIVQAITDRQRQLASDGDRWYRQQLAALPTGDTASALAERLRQLNLMRDQVLADNRPDAQSRYQEALTKLGQLLDAARRQARQALDAGRITDVPTLASDLAPAFAGTPLVDAQRQFSVLCREASSIKPQWQGTWALTRPRLLAAKGADALAAAAALLLVGDTAEAKTLLAHDPALASGDLLRRREALSGRSVAVLTFDQADDLRFIEVITGEPRMAAGSLTAAAGEPVALSCATPLRNAGWEVVAGSTLDATQAEGQALFSLVTGDAVDAQVRVEATTVALKVRTAAGWEESQIARPAGKALRVRLAERAGTVLISLNDQKVLTAANAKISAGAVFRFEAVGVAWALTDLQVVAGE